MIARAWVAIVLAGVAVAAGLVYVIVWQQSKHTIRNILVNHMSLDSGAVFSCGSTLTLQVLGNHLAGGVDWDYSADSGVTFTSIQTGVKNNAPAQWVIGSDVFSNHVILRVRDSMHPGVHKETAEFTVRPQLKLMAGLKPGTVFLAPGTVMLPFTTTSSLLTADNLEIQTSSDGISFDAPSDKSEIQILAKERVVRWAVDATMANRQIWVRLTSTDLVTKGHPSELVSDTANPITFAASGSSGTAGNFFTSFRGYGSTQMDGEVFDDSSHITRGTSVYLGFESKQPLLPADVSFFYQTTTSNTWFPAKVTPMGTLFQLDLPAPDVNAAPDPDTKITFKVVYSNSPDTPQPFSLLGPFGFTEYVYTEGLDFSFIGNYVDSFSITLHSTALITSEDKVKVLVSVAGTEVENSNCTVTVTPGQAVVRGSNLMNSNSIPLNSQVRFAIAPSGSTQTLMTEILTFKAT